MSNSSGREGQRRLSKKELRQKKKIQRTVGVALTVVMLICMAIFAGLLMYLDILPTTYMIAGVVVLVLIILYVFLSQFTKAHMVGKVVAVILSIIMAFGSYYLAVANGALNDMTTPNEVVDVMSVVVLASDGAESINETSGYIYGINTESNKELIDETISHVNEELGSDVQIVEYENWPSLVDALYLGEVQAMVFNEGYRTTMEEYYISFSSDTKVLGYKEIENAVVQVEVPDKEITNESFTVLISGNDSAGKISSTGRSDVNIIATINPETKQVFLVTTPRDSYVKLYYGDGTDSGSSKDKLTHAGNKGMACSMATLEALYEVEIDYYVRLNFTGLIKLVDALGGIVVESDYAFKPYAYSEYPFTYVEGKNYLNGEQALIFARERYAFPDGDFQRSRNQVKVIQAIADKALSITMLTNYTGIMNSLSDVVTTNIPQEQMTKLVKMQLEDMATWTIKSFNVTGATGSVPNGSRNMSVVYPDENQLALARAKINAVEEGKDPDQVTSVTVQ